MALLQIDASGGAPRLFGAAEPAAPAIAPALASALASTQGPTTILVHGYKYAPGAGIHCPHIGLFAMKSRSPNPRVISWPRHLETGGLTLGFGWSGRGGLRAVYGRAAQAGVALADLVRLLRDIDPTRPVHILCHSMGARVALSALGHLPACSVTSVLMLAAAEYRSVAGAHLQSPAAQSADIWHITSGENDLYDFLFERVIPRPEASDAALGTRALPGMARIVLDDSETLAQLAALGHRIAPPSRRICHWSPYLRGGVFGLYSALIRGDLCPILLRQRLPRPARGRWSHVLAAVPARVPHSPPLPITQDASL